MPVAVSQTARGLFLAIAILACAGVVVSAISLQHHYSTSDASFCNISETINCDVVNRSVYSKIFGIPVALVGIVGYVVLFACATVFRGRRGIAKLLLFASRAGLVFALYLTYIEGWVLGVWCVLCLTSLGFISAIAVCSTAVTFERQRAHGSQ
jgi:vitamin-K-epoxide reductase (warfarin-sensitive)